MIGSVYVTIVLYMIEKFLHTGSRAEKEKSDSFDAEAKAHRLVEGGFAEEARIFEKVVAFARVVEESGGRALSVGGSVRDEVMGTPPKDYDIEVYGIEPDCLKGIVAGFGTVNEVGVAFGILKVRVDAVDLDISLPRRESTTGVGHRDFAVAADPFMSPKEAARRRDFTCNALARDILTGELHDYFGGLRDIGNRVLRVTDSERFRDDPLRVLRGVQFVGRFGLCVDDETSAVMRDMRRDLEHLPKERLREEWIKLFLRSRKPSLGLQAAMELGIFHQMHPDIVRLPLTPQSPEWHPEGDVWIHTLMVVDEAAKIIEQEHLEYDDALSVMLAAFCHDFGKSDTTKEIDGKIRALGHEEAGADPAEKFLYEIGIEAAVRERVKKLVVEHLKPTMLYSAEVLRGQQVSDGAIKRLAAKVHPATLKQLVCVAKADNLGRGPFVDPAFPERSFMPSEYPAGDWLLKRASVIGVEESKPKPVLFGRDLIAFGFKPSPFFGKIIRLSEDLHEQGDSREEILVTIHRCVRECEETGQEVSLEAVFEKMRDRGE